MPTLALTGALQRAENPDQTVELFPFGPSLEVDYDSSDFVTLAPEEEYNVNLGNVDTLTVIVMYSTIPLSITCTVGEDNVTFQGKQFVLFDSNLTGFGVTNPSLTLTAKVRIVTGG